MKKINYLVVALFAGLLLLSGCRTNPVMNINDAAITVSGKYTKADVKKAIVTAGQSLGWVMKDKAPGHLIGSLYLRTHIAIVDVKYDKNKYSITYKDSTNLNYDGVNIHSNYNGWVQNLNVAIQGQLAGL